MSRNELWNVLKFVKERGVVHESEIWKEFTQGESGREEIRVKWLIEELNMKGLVIHGYNKKGECLVKYAGLESQ